MSNVILDASLSDKNRLKVVKSHETADDYSSYGGGSGGGDDMLEVRVAKLEANVEDIKANLAEARSDIRAMRETTAQTSRDVAVILQKQLDIDEKLSKKPSISDMNVAITSAINKQIIWTILTAISIAGLSLTAAKLLF